MRAPISSAMVPDISREMGTEPGLVEWRNDDSPVPYEQALAAMEQRVAAIRDGTARELVWLLEHPPLYTAGTSARPQDLLDPSRLPVHRTGRGGQYTYHGPGQRIAYVMLDLEKWGRDVRCHVWRLEEWIIATLARFNVKGQRREGRVGVWVAGHPGDQGGREDKTAAMGVPVPRGVKYPVLPLNVVPAPDPSRGIVPCGAAPAISAPGVPSLPRLGITASMPEVDIA